MFNMTSDQQIMINILVALTIIAVIVILWYTGRKTIAKKIVFYLVVQAERELGGGTGKLKYATVIGKVYPILPTIVRTFVSDKQLDEWIEEGVDQLKTVCVNSSNTVRDTVADTNKLGSTQSVLESLRKPPEQQETNKQAGTTDGGEQNAKLQK